MARRDRGRAPFVDHDPTDKEIETLRLFLSTFQDGSGQLRTLTGTLPGWRDFERAIAEFTGGICTEDKGIFDVLCPLPEANSVAGLSCKMRQELARIGRDGRVTIELSNSSKRMWMALDVLGISAANYKTHATRVGCALVELVSDWHQAAAIRRGQIVDRSKSSYISLLWNKKTGEYRIFRFPLMLPDPNDLEWYFPKSSRGTAEHLNGDDAYGGRVFEWYGESGGQLKYYPHSKDALWTSPVFKLEKLHASGSATLAAKAAAYFLNRWSKQ